VLVAFYAWRTTTRNVDWRSQESLWTATIRQNAGSPIGWAFIGGVHEAKGEMAEAEAAYKTSYQLAEGAGFFNAESHDHHAALLAGRGDARGAEAEYRLVLEKRPRQFTALVNVGEILLHDPARLPEAIDFLKRASAVRPDDFMPHANLSQAYKVLDRLPEALASIERAVALRPRDGDLWDVKAEILGLMGRQEDAAAATREAARLHAGR
jgi:tetratricopeptide (TPR) repeat protein